MRLTLLLLVLFLGTSVRAQRVLLFEQLTSSKSERVYEGEALRFRMKGDNFWQEGYIREMRPDIQALVINDRYILLEEIDAVFLGHTIASKLGYGLITFGAGWSFFAALGYATDKIDETNYSVDDALVTAASVGTGFLLVKLLGRRKFRPGKYKRLRVVDLSF
ncbi:hypothetical protein GGR26_001962 [Lewinella marina]|uniref:Uncharacterized protein n=1 Tax=Neolewinella marina TaxID=438751 RepID=A0A2G0CHD1_9BACT|nr:hypothetical protein [Neolewinella marina]NJB86194.1 hypothetical protein [Neolewinella marina]PHK99330.1 hypothetical protein CGL56_07715 [Neolewinella marina]